MSDDALQVDLDEIGIGSFAEREVPMRQRAPREVRVAGSRAAISGIHDVLTTGQIAKICQVAPRTVSKWFDSGRLKGHLIPDSKDRRVPVNALIDFMLFNKMPLGELERFVVGESILMIGFVDSTYAERLRAAAGPFAALEFVSSTVEAGIVWHSRTWRVIVLNVESLGQDSSIWLADRVRKDFPGVTLVGIRPRLDDPNALYRKAFRETIPFGSDPVLVMERILSFFGKR